MRRDAGRQRKVFKHEGTAEQLYGEVEFHCDKAVSSGVTRKDRERYLPKHEGAAEQLYGEVEFHCDEAVSSRSVPSLLLMLRNLGCPFIRHPYPNSCTRKIGLKRNFSSRQSFIVFDSLSVCIFLLYF